MEPFVVPIMFVPVITADRKPNPRRYTGLSCEAPHPVC
jgi:hypothetical protein